MNLDLRVRCRKVKSIIATFAYSPQLSSLFLFSRKHVCQEMKRMTPEVRNCPFCGRFLPEEIWKEKNQTIQKESGSSSSRPHATSVKHEGVKCPRCGGTRIWKCSRYFTAQGEDFQRYLCRDCEYRFIKR